MASVMTRVTGKRLNLSLVCKSIDNLALETSGGILGTLQYTLGLTIRGCARCVQ